MIMICYLHLIIYHKSFLNITFKKDLLFKKKSTISDLLEIFKVFSQVFFDYKKRIFRKRMGPHIH